MMKRTTSLAALCLVLAVASSACLLGSEPECDECRLQEIDPAGTPHTFVVDSVSIPTSAQTVQEVGVNLDNDEQGRPDNAMGQILAMVDGVFENDSNVTANDAVRDGRILQIIQISTTSMDSAGGVGVSVYMGLDSDGDPTNNFSGDAFFGLDEAYDSSPMVGMIHNGRLTASLGTMPLKIVLPHVGGEFVLPLRAAAIEARIEDGKVVDGKLAGALSEQDVRDYFLPVVHESISASVALDCVGTVCPDGSDGRTLLDLFDTNDDGTVSFDELAEAPVVKSLLRPDLDLFDENGDLLPHQDGVKESLSMGVGFTATPAHLSVIPR